MIARMATDDTRSLQVRPTAATFPRPRAKALPTQCALPGCAPRTRAPAIAQQLQLGGGNRSAVAARRRDVEGRVTVEEPGWLQSEPAPGDRHHRPFLGPGEMGRPEGVPEHDVGAVDVLFAGGEGRQPRAAVLLVHEVPGWVALSGIVPGDPQVVSRETRPGANRRRGIGE